MYAVKCSVLNNRAYVSTYGQFALYGPFNILHFNIFPILCDRQDYELCSTQCFSVQSSASLQIRYMEKLLIFQTWFLHYFILNYWPLCKFMLSLRQCRANRKISGYVVQLCNKIFLNLNLGHCAVLHEVLVSENFKSPVDFSP